MKIGLHMGYWWGTDIGSDIKAIIAYTAQTGVDYLEINPRYFLHATSQERKDMRSYTQDLGLGILINGGAGEEADLASDSLASRKAGVAFWHKMLKAAQDLAAPVWSGVIYSTWLRHPVGPYPQSAEERQRAREYCIASLRELGHILDDYDIVIGLEVVNRYEQFLMNTAQEGVCIAEAAGNDKIQLLLDTFHMNIEEDNMADAIRYAADHHRLAHLHAGESNRRVPCGGGNIHWQEIGAVLKAIDYNGAIMMEPFVLKNADNAHRTCTWRNLMEEPIRCEHMVEMARNGATFLRGLKQ